jgi:peroxiredoxin
MQGTVCRPPVPLLPLLIKQVNFIAKMSFDVTSKDIFALKLIILIQRGGCRTVTCPHKSFPLLFTLRFKKKK